MGTSYSAAPFRAEVPMLVSDLARDCLAFRWSRRHDVSMGTFYSAAPFRAEVPMLLSEFSKLRGGVWAD